MPTPWAYHWTGMHMQFINKVTGIPTAQTSDDTNVQLRRETIMLTNLLYPRATGCKPGVRVPILWFHYSIMQWIWRGSTSNVLTLMLYWSEKMIRNSMYLSLNTRLIHKTSNRLTLITVFCFRVDPRSLLWRYIKLMNSARLIIPGYVKTCQILSSILFMSYKLWLNNYSLGHQCQASIGFGTHGGCQMSDFRSSLPIFTRQIIHKAPASFYPNYP